MRARVKIDGLFALWGVDARGAARTGGTPGCRSARHAAGAQVGALVGVLVAVVMMVGVGGCGATRHPSVGVPGDFALGVTVLREDNGASAPRAQRPGQYLLETDGALRAAVGPGVGADTYPPRIRRLNPRQVERLWTLVEGAGLATFPHAARVSDVRDFRPTPKNGWAIFDVTARGERQSIALRVDEDARAAQIADEMAGLAWIRP